LNTEQSNEERRRNNEEKMEKKMMEKTKKITPIANLEVVSLVLISAINFSPSSRRVRNVKLHD